MYVAFVFDAYARRVLGWKVSKSMTTDLVLDAINQAASVNPRTSPDIRSLEVSMSFSFKGRVSRGFQCRIGWVHTVLFDQKRNPLGSTVAR